MSLKIIFIVPYKNREHQKIFFSNYMKHILEDYSEDEYEIYFSHQTDEREFNRGATKNIGFLAMKSKYPDTYKNITFVFNDVDTIPHKKNLFNYETTVGIVKHFYGFHHALGGIFSITGEDFEKVNGFPNNWGWGFEDNTINARILNEPSLTIDRSKFWSIGDNNIIQLFDSVTRAIVLKNKEKFINDNINDGLTTVSNLSYSLEDEMINIKTFDVLHNFVKKEVKNVNFFTEERKTMFNMRTVVGNNDQRQSQKQVQQTRVAVKNNRKMFRMF
tara:strand:+ start:278 stop:1099 length:822 start_codon:yes stop_codon:yes gene_type:complete